MSEHSGVDGKTPFALARAQGAARRREARDRRTDAEQLALLDGRPGEARRERARLSP